MTQSNNQSVRSEAEAALNTNRIPTFEEVYAMPYVQESIRAIIDQNVRQYPILASHEDDLKQELLVAIWKELPKYDSGKATIKTYLRLVMHSAMKTARREYFSETNLSLALADDIADYDFNDEDSTISQEKRQMMLQVTGDPMELEMLRKDVASVLEYLPEELRNIAQRIMDGESLRQIGESLGLDHNVVKYRYIRPLREAFKKYL